MKKNITIVTFQNAYNYGAILQCFALQETTKQFANKVEILNYDNKIISDSYKEIVNLKANLLIKTKAILSSIYFYSRVKKRNNTFRNFINNHLQLTNLLSKEEILKKKYTEKDILITGSDQVWNTKLINGVDEIYFLNFPTKAKKISYAASIGTKDIQEEKKEEIKTALEGFDYISVREETAKKALGKIIKSNIDVVLDPTLLMDKNMWNKYLSEERIVKEKYIFVYMANQSVIELAKDIAKKENFKIVNIDKKKKYGSAEIYKFGANPFEFLRLIRDAEYIVTTSFHGTALSIIFNKNFWVIPPTGLSSRITDLLKILKIENRIVKDNNQLNYQETIDYDKVNKTIETERKRSIKIIENNLK